MCVRVSCLTLLTSWNCSWSELGVVVAAVAVCLLFLVLSSFGGVGVVSSFTSHWFTGVPGVQGQNVEK